MLEGIKQTLQGTVQELRGASLALQESSVKCTELQEENWQLWKQAEELGIQLQKKKASSQHLETLNEELEGDLEQQFNIIHTLRAHRASQNWGEEKSQAVRLRQQDQLQQEAALQELRKLLTTKRETLQQDQEAKVLAAQENERLRQEVDRFPAAESQGRVVWATWLTCLRQTLEEEKRHFRSQIKNQSRTGWPSRTGAFYRCYKCKNFQHHITEVSEPHQGAHTPDRRQWPRPQSSYLCWTLRPGLRDRSGAGTEAGGSNGVRLSGLCSAEESGGSGTPIPGFGAQPASGPPCAAGTPPPTPPPPRHQRSAAC